jgi:ABC-type transport system substrate-binding protein
VEALGNAVVFKEDAAGTEIVSVGWMPIRMKRFALPAKGYGGRASVVVGAVGLVVLASSCSNTPYPGVDSEEGKSYYSAFREPPKNLDPQVSYTTADGAFLTLCYERLLGYRYLERPVELISELAVRVPEPETLTNSVGAVVGVRYQFEIHPGVHFIDDPCFPDGKGRELKASDFEFVFKRIADPSVNCPVFQSFSHISGFSEYREKIRSLRAEMEKALVDAGEAKENINLSFVELYNRAGPIDGIQVTGDYTFDLVLSKSYPQILYWLAMRFVSAVPWEAVDFYHGRKDLFVKGVPMDFKMRPVGTGAYRFQWQEFNRESRIVMVRNENWWGMGEIEVSDVTRFPFAPGAPENVELNIWSEEIAGRKLGMIDRVEWYLERESLSRFNKFIQGYYDGSAIPLESFDKVIQNDDLTPEMRSKGIRLVKDFGLDIFYIAFNMQDDTVGAPVKFKDPKLEANREEELDRRRKFRRAMSLAVDSGEYIRIFFNDLGVQAQSPLPPGLFGYDPDYRNPYRQYDPDLKLARQLLAEAGYENGIDPKTGNPLQLTFDTGSIDTRTRVVYNFFIDSWKRLGLEVKLAATDYNKFQEKMQDGNYQIFPWGWVADYPDPENFLFLLHGPNSKRHGDHNPNSAQYESDAYDFLFKKMENLPNEGTATWTETDPDSGEEVQITLNRREIIDQLILILQEDCPWIPNIHSVQYLLYHEWLKSKKPHPLTLSSVKYLDIDGARRAKARRTWNRPIRWPAFALCALILAFLVPGVITIRKERR